MTTDGDKTFDRAITDWDVVFTEVKRSWLQSKVVKIFFFLPI